MFSTILLINPTGQKQVSLLICKLWLLKAIEAPRAALSLNVPSLPKPPQSLYCGNQAAEHNPIGLPASDDRISSTVLEHSSVPVISSMWFAIYTQWPRPWTFPGESLTLVTSGASLHTYFVDRSNEQELGVGSLHKCPLKYTSKHWTPTNSLNFPTTPATSSQARAPSRSPRPTAKSSRL